MSAFEIAKIYSRALFDLCTTDDCLKKNLNYLDLISSALNEKIMHFFSSPHLDFLHKKTVLEKALGKDADKEFLAFLFHLIKQNYFKYLPEIFKHFKKQVNEKLGVLEIRLLTASKAVPTLSHALSHKLEKIWGKKILITHEIAPELLGGAILFIHNKMLDFSLKSKLTALRHHLLQSHRDNNAIKA